MLELRCLRSYRGFGHSSGTPTETGLLQDALAIWEFVHSRAGPDTRVFIYSQSLGTAVGIKLAAALTEGNKHERTLDSCYILSIEQRRH
jgi:alpha/beta superfamily hydrolase